MYEFISVPISAKFMVKKSKHFRNIFQNISFSLGVFTVILFGSVFFFMTHYFSVWLFFFLRMSNVEYSVCSPRCSYDYLSAIHNEFVYANACVNTRILLYWEICRSVGTNGRMKVLKNAFIRCFFLSPSLSS